MAKYDSEYIQALNALDNLTFDHRFTSFFNSPLNKELLSHKLALIEQQLKEEEDLSGETGRGKATHHNYTDFLLPLPDDLIPSETGMVHPDVVNASQASRGLDTKMDSNSRKALEQKCAKELKQKLAMKNTNRPRMGMMPSPHGTVKRERED